jgi:hypothetical protein
MAADVQIVWSKRVFPCIEPIIFHFLFLAKLESDAGMGVGIDQDLKDARQNLTPLKSLLKLVGSMLRYEAMYLCGTS